MTITELLNHYSIPTAPAGHHHVSHGWIGVDCPNCSKGESRWRLGINLAHLYCSCWSCGHRPLFDTLAELTGEHPATLHRLLAGAFSIVSTPPEKPKGKLTIPSGVGPLLPAHHRYLERRGLDPHQLEQLWGVKGIGLATRLAWRIWIPIHLHGEIVSWTTRSISDKANLRYITAKVEEESTPAKELLYGADHARHSIVIVEGPIDVWKIGPGAVATLGISYSRAQLRRMAEFPLRVVCFDNEPKAQERAMKICHELKDFHGTTKRVVLRSKDPRSASKWEIKKLRKEFLE